MEITLIDTFLPTRLYRMRLQVGSHLTCQPFAQKFDTAEVCPKSSTSMILISYQCAGDFDNPSEAIEEAIGGDVVNVVPTAVYKYQEDSGGNVTRSVVEGDLATLKMINIFPPRERTGLIALPADNTGASVVH